MEIRLPPRYKNLSAEEIARMKVKVVSIRDGKWDMKEFANIKEAAASEDLSNFLGAMVDRDSNQNYALRFESKEAYARLSA